MGSPQNVRTRAQVEFHSHERVLRIDGRHPQIARVVSCNTDKTFGPAAGSFSLVLKRVIGKDPDFHSLFDEGEDIWMKIRWIKNGRKYDGLVGITDSIHINTKRDAEGRRVETINVTGFDFGKIFEKTSLFINMYERGGALPCVPIYDAVQSRLIGRPDQIIRALVDAWLGNSGPGSSGSLEKQWLLPPSLLGRSGARRFAWDWINFASTVSPNLRGLIGAVGLLHPNGGGSLWDSMQEYSNPVLNEMWCDLAPDPDVAGGPLDQMRPALIMRERPFPTRVSSDRWNALRTWNLDPKDVNERDLVSDGMGRFNYWTMRVDTGGGADLSLAGLNVGGPPFGKPGSMPIYDVDSVQKHGIRKFEQSTRYLPINDRSRDVTDATAAGASGQAQSYWLQVCVQWLRMVHDWYVIVPKQFTGRIVTSSIMPWIRIGDRLIERRRDGAQWEYYVERVSHSYSYPQNGSTELGLTRGQPVGSDFLTEQYRRYGEVDVSTMSDADLTAASSGTASADLIGAPDMTFTLDEVEAFDQERSTDDAPVASGSQVTEPIAAEATNPLEDWFFSQGIIVRTPEERRAEEEALASSPRTPALPPRGRRR